MTQVFDYSDLRPYRDEEVGAALAALARDETMWAVLARMFPDLARGEVLARFDEIDSVSAFQARIMEPAVSWAIADTMTEFSVSGLDGLTSDRCYLFISNHRDITLDSALLAWATHRQWGGTMEMAIGDNLLAADWMTHLFKLNKTVIVARGLARRELLAASKKLSAYIADRVTGGHDSFWIAQAEGRSKDGSDRTHSGLLKMLILAGGKDWSDHTRALAPIPVAISYEWDPCDLMKARERLGTSRDAGYRKAPGDDLRSIATGITGHKGRVHLAVGTPLSDDWPAIETAASRNDGIVRLQQAIDAQIHALYRLWPNHYLAHDLLDGTTRFSDRYTREDRDAMDTRLAKALADEPDADALRTLILEMYANPVKNQLGLADA